MPTGGDGSGAEVSVIPITNSVARDTSKGSFRNGITTLALYGHGSETIQFFSMGHGKIHFPIIIYGSISIFFEIFCNKV